MNPLTNPTAQGVDNVLIYIFGFSLLLLAGITLVMIWFVIRYRRSKNPEPTSNASHSLVLETLWTLLPTLIVLTMFWYGWVNYKGLRNVPEGAMEVEAVGRMWSWQFKYENGRTSSKLYVPEGEPIKVKLTSTDVIHSFFMPAFRIKRDVVPGMENYLWFQAPEAGSYDIFCAEYCGTGHADMITVAEVLPRPEFDSWYSDQSAASKVPKGRQLLDEHGCLGCHSLDGSAGIGPSLLHLSQHEQEKEVDPEHIRESIRKPEADLVEGYQPIMPAYGEDQLSDADLQEIVDFLMKGQQETESSTPDGHELIEHNGCLGCHSTDGSDMAGPTFKGLKGRSIKVKRDGETLTLQVDAEYLRRALRQPQAEVVEGFPPIMPSYDQLSDEEIEAIVETLLKM